MTPFTLPTRCEFLAFADQMFDGAAILQGIGPREYRVVYDDPWGKWPEAIFAAQTLCDLFDWLETGYATWRAAWALDDPKWFHHLLIRAKNHASDLSRCGLVCCDGTRRFRSIADAISSEVRRRQQTTGASSLSRTEASHA